MATEKRNPYSANISSVSTEEMLRLINKEDRTVPEIVAESIPALAVLVDKAVESVQNGGRIFYCGAGTSGRLAVVDASECSPTYGLDPTVFNAVMAGGRDAVFRAAEGMEDSREGGIAAFKEAGCSDKDIVIGVSASGQAPFVIAFMEEAAKLGCFVGAVVNNPDAPMITYANQAVLADTGPEVIMGSTRMKAGTSQKLILNMFSTAVCIKLGCVYGNYMINMRVTNRKLRQRAVNMFCEITEADEISAVSLLEKHGWVIREALREYLGQ